MALLLLSRINGDAPRASVLRRRSGWFERVGRPFNGQKPLPVEHHLREAFAATVTTKSTSSVGSFSWTTPARGSEEHSHVNETLRREPLVPDFERRTARTVLAGGHR